MLKRPVCYFLAVFEIMWLNVLKGKENKATSAKN